MPKALNDIKKHENLLEIKKKICQILEDNKGKALILDEIEFYLMKDSNLGIHLGGKLFLYTIMEDLINQKKINSIISGGKQYFYVEK
ncbi:MAG: hypothetical protein EU535_05370 [Promethearchaeota archaeon]|nr:MAG: hypothetical protein EU535_05370 [Candidatus Lokiarchaeota archaeon]